jgi:hypothetical protein
MHVKASEGTDAKEQPAFVETDHQPTKLGYGEGGVPFYVAVIWVGYILAYILVMAYLALPDYRAWLNR